MLFIASFLLGIALAAAGLVAKQINSAPGTQLANKKAHRYFTTLGALSGHVLPLAAVVAAMASQGLAGGLVSGVLIAAGAFALGLLRPVFPARMLLALAGVPVAGVLFLASL